MISYSETKKFYETTPAWDDDIYGQFTPCYFTNFIKNELEPLIVSDSMKVLNAGSGGYEYCSKDFNGINYPDIWFYSKKMDSSR